MAHDTVSCEVGANHAIVAGVINAPVYFNQGEDPRQRLQDSLYYESFNHRRDEVKEKHPDTFCWIFHDGRDQGEHQDRPVERKWHSFEAWLSNRSDVKLPMYWITGKPGAGKTTLAKYILDASETVKALRRWWDGVVIISHFFWKPAADVMAKNHKGFLCSLLYQLLDHDMDVVVDKILKQVPTASKKTAPSYWTERELETCINLVIGGGPPMFVMVDGVDEMISQGEQNRVLEFLKWIHRHAHVKVCVASRPETHIQTHLSACHRLRLQDLTYHDLLTYALDQIPNLSHIDDDDDNDDDENISSLVGNKWWSVRERLALSLVDRAEGVFLWLFLVIESLKYGEQQYNTSKELRKRIEQLPLGLERLYNEMWLRFGTNERGIHKDTTQLILTSMITMHKIAEENDEPISLAVYKDGRVSVYALVCVMDPTLLAAILSEDLEVFSVALKKIERQCRALSQSIAIKTAGLVHVVHPSAPAERCCVNPPRSRGSELEHAFVQVTWIHRTAFDFLTDTKEGKNILLGCKVDQSQLVWRILQACLARDRIIGIVARGTIAGFCFIITHPWADESKTLNLPTSDRLRLFKTFAYVYWEILKDWKDPAVSIFHLSRGQDICGQFLLYLTLIDFQRVWVCILYQFWSGYSPGLDNGLRSELLLFTSVPSDLLTGRMSDQTLDMYQTLLQAGADPHWQSTPIPAWMGNTGSTPQMPPETPFIQCLRVTLQCVVRRISSLFGFDFDDSIGALSLMLEQSIREQRKTTRAWRLSQRWLPSPFASSAPACGQRAEYRGLCITDRVDCFLRFSPSPRNHYYTFNRVGIIPPHFLASPSAVKATLINGDIVMRYTLTISDTLALLLSFCTTGMPERKDWKLLDAHLPSFQSLIKKVCGSGVAIGALPKGTIQNVWQVSTIHDMIDLVEVEATDEERSTMAMALTQALVAKIEDKSLVTVLSEYFDPPSTFLDGRRLTSNVLTFNLPLTVHTRRCCRAQEVKFGST